MDCKTILIIERKRDMRQREGSPWVACGGPPVQRAAEVAGHGFVVRIVKMDRSVKQASLEAQCRRKHWLGAEYLHILNVFLYRLLFSCNVSPFTEKQSIPWLAVKMNITNIPYFPSISIWNNRRDIKSLHMKFIQGVYSLNVHIRQHLTKLNWGTLCGLTGPIPWKCQCHERKKAEK